MHDLIGLHAEAFSETATTRQDVFGVTVTGERPIECRIELGERCPLIDRVPVAHHQHDPATRRGQLTPTAVLLCPAHFEDAARRPVDRIECRRLPAHGASFPSKLPGMNARDDDAQTPEHKLNVGELVAGAVAGVAVDRIANELLAPPPTIPIPEHRTGVPLPDAATGDPWTYRVIEYDGSGPLRFHLYAWRELVPLFARISSTRSISTRIIPLRYWARGAWSYGAVPEFGVTTVTLTWRWNDMITRTGEFTIDANRYV